MAPSAKLASRRAGLPTVENQAILSCRGRMTKTFTPTRIDTDPGHHIRMGLVAAISIMIASWGVGWLPQAQNSWSAGTTVLNPLRVWTAGVTVSAIGLVTGGLLLVRSWLRLGQALQLPYTVSGAGPNWGAAKESARKHRINDQIGRASWRT